MKRKPCKPSHLTKSSYMTNVQRGSGKSPKYRSNSWAISLGSSVANVGNSLLSKKG